MESKGYLHKEYLNYKKYLLYKQFSSIKDYGTEVDLKQFLKNLSEIDLEPELMTMVKKWIPSKYKPASLLLSLRN